MLKASGKRDDDRKGRHLKEKFDFLGYTFRPRRSKNRWGKLLLSFTPAVSNDAAAAPSTGSVAWLVESLGSSRTGTLMRARDRQGFGWKRWSTAWIYTVLGVFRDYRVQYQVRA
jgi:RNA-directed DNA polymerase